MNKCHTTLINLYIYIWWVFESLLLWVWWPYPILWQPLGFVIATAIAAGDAACFAASCHSVHPPRKLLYLARQGTKQPSPRWYPSACPDQTPCTNWHDWRPNAVAMAAAVSARVAVSWVPCKFPGLQSSVHCLTQISHGMPLQGLPHNPHNPQNPALSPMYLLCRWCEGYVASSESQWNVSEPTQILCKSSRMFCCLWNDLEVSVGRTKWCCFDFLLFWNSIMFMFFVLLIVYHFNSGV